MTTNIESQKSKVQTLEEVLDRKNKQLVLLKEGLKIAEALNYGVKNVSKKIEDIVSPKTPEVFQLLLEAKITPDTYKIISDMMTSIESSLKVSSQDAEKILYTRQCEINFLQSDITQLKTELAGSLTVLADLEKSVEIPAKEEKKTEYIRPDKNPNTRAGRASMDLAARKAAWKAKQEAEGLNVIVEESMVEVEEPQPEKELVENKTKKGKKKLFNLF